MNFVDKVVSYFSPTSGLKRVYSRKALSYLDDNGFQVPGSRRKVMRGNTARLQSPARDIDRKLEGMRAFSRDASMSMPLAVSIFNRFKVNVIGSGLLVQPRPDISFLDVPESYIEDFVKFVTNGFDIWSNSIEADYCNSATGNELEGLIYVTQLVNGDAFYMMPWVKPKRANWPFETTVKVIDPDLVRTPDDKQFVKNLGGTFDLIRNGVEHDADGRLVAYWVADFYADDPNPYGNWTRVPLYNDSGMQQIFHVADQQRISQRRGIPLLAPVAENLSMATKLKKSELMAALVSSFFSVFVRDSSGLDARLQEGFTPNEVVTGGGGDGPDVEQMDKIEGEEFSLEMGHGNVMYLGEDKNIEIAETRDKRDFAPFYKAIATELAATTGAPYEVIMLEFQKSYSAMRGAINEAAKVWKSERVRNANQVKRVWYERIVLESVLRGYIQAPKFFKDLFHEKAWTRSIWIGAGQGSVDQYKESRASNNLVAGAMATREEEYIARTGERWLPMVERLKKENELLGIEQQRVSSSGDTLDPVMDAEDVEDSEDEGNSDE